MTGSSEHATSRTIWPTSSRPVKLPTAPLPPRSYNTFVEPAVDLDPRYAVFVMPSRWFAGGKGLVRYR
jgi:hypothetical protein